MANSWHAWHLGQLRIINHGLYAGFATFLGAELAYQLSEGRFIPEILLLSGAAFVCAGLWGQLLEGSERLKRPFGYFGFIVGVALTLPMLWGWGSDLWYLSTALSVGGLFAQGIARLRCLVNGCCHGQLSSPAVGIKVQHPQSRVTKISDLHNQPIHATQIYSLVWLVLSGIVTLYLWSQQVPFSLIVGLYFILSGLGRFVEEAYRGEVQTNIVRGLRSYQWMSIVFVLIGIVLTCFPTQATPGWPSLQWNVQLLSASFGFALLVIFLFGVDFPVSNRRFSRL